MKILAEGPRVALWLKTGKKGWLLLGAGVDPTNKYTTQKFTGRKDENGKMGNPMGFFVTSRTNVMILLWTKPKQMPILFFLGREITEKNIPFPSSLIPPYI